MVFSDLTSIGSAVEEADLALGFAGTEEFKPPNYKEKEGNHEPLHTTIRSKSKA